MVPTSERGLPDRHVPQPASHRQAGPQNGRRRAVEPGGAGWARAPDGGGSAAWAGGVFFLFGFGTKQQDLGPGEVRTCPRCGNTTQWARVRR